MISVIENKGQIIDMENVKIAPAREYLIKSGDFFAYVTILKISGRNPLFEAEFMLFLLSFAESITNEEIKPQMTATEKGMKNICCRVSPMLTIIIPETRVAIRLPTEAHKLMVALVLPSLSEGTRSPISAVHAGVAIEPKSAWIAIRTISWLGFVTNIMGIQRAEIIKPPKIMKGILLPSLSLIFPQKTCITLFERLAKDWNHPISEDEAPSSTAYAPMKGFTIPKPKELTTERA